MAKKVKKLEDVKPEDTTEAIEEVETPVEEVVEEKPTEVVGEVPTELVEDIKEDIKELTTEAETLPKVEFNEEVAPKGYSSLITPKDKKDELRMKNGRIYKEIGNGFGMYLDNGGTFRI